MRAIFLGVFFLTLPVAAGARTWVVRADGTGDAPTIKAAVESTSVGDTVGVECGVYREHDIRMKSGLTLRGLSNDSSCVVIDAEHANRGIYCNLVTGSAIERITIAHAGPYDGLFAWQSTLSIASCVFEDNRSGLYAARAPTSAVVTNCVFRHNVNTTYGAGVSMPGQGTLTFSQCVFVGNRTSGRGGAVYAEAVDVTFDDCLFYGNVASEGGGVCSVGGGAKLFRRCTFLDNAAGRGGGLVSRYPLRDELDTCVFAHNHATGFGLGDGGGAVYSVWTFAASLPIRNCTLVGNSAQDRGAALYCTGAGAVATLDHTIVAFNEGGEAVYTYLDSPPPTLSCCDLFGNAYGDWTRGIADQATLRGNFSADPLFCDAAGGVWTLHSTSPCAPPGITGCGVVGALEVGCGGAVSVEPFTWARIKGAYR
ncbi:MAG: right-handed parallel beta-helix repeat-containing protein [bacterium]